MGKLNFDLKLELFHRRQRDETNDIRMKKMTEQLEKMTEKMKSQGAELVEAQNINDKLLQELEKRDQAIQEAVAMICELEEKIEKPQEASTPSIPLMIVPQILHENASAGETLPLLDSARSSSGPKTPEDRHTSRDYTLPAIPNSGSLPKSTGTTSTLHRMPLRPPSFLKSDSGSTNALRSLYLADENNLRESPSFVSTSRPLSLHSTDEYGMLSKKTTTR